MVDTGHYPKDVDIDVAGLDAILLFITSISLPHHLSLIAHHVLLLSPSHMLAAGLITFLHLADLSLSEGLAKEHVRDGAARKIANLTYQHLPEAV